MPSAGGVCPPVIIPLRENYDGKSCNNISSHTYVELETGKFNVLNGIYYNYSNLNILEKLT